MEVGVSECFSAMAIALLGGEPVIYNVWISMFKMIAGVLIGLPSHHKAIFLVSLIVTSAIIVAYLLCHNFIATRVRS